MGELVAARAGEHGAAMESVAAPDGAMEAQGALEREVQLLDEVLAVWRARALDGDPVAVDKVLEVQKQRLVLLQLWPEGQRGQAVKVSAGAAARGDEREVRVVVEYVDDWRQAGRRSAD
jgi:hypothetical protein